MAPNAFSLAIASFVSEIRHNEDIRNPFYRKVLVQMEKSTHEDPAAQHKQCADDFAEFIQDLERKQKRESRTLWITEKLRPLLSGLAQYTSVCDIMIQAAGSTAVLLYGGARLILQLAQNFYNCFDTILSIMEEVGNLLQCYHIFSNVYQSSPEMQILLVESYKNIVSFWMKASKLLSRKAYKTLLIGIVKPLDVEWQNCRQGLQNNSVQVQRLAQATEADLRRQKDLDQAVHQKRKAWKEIIDWIKACEDDDKLDFRGDIRDNMDIRHKNTCEWLFEHPDMKKWLGAKKTTALWYSAGPGAGKTILASAVARKLQDDGLRTVTFLYAFDDVVRRQPITALRCLALQLLTALSHIPDKVQRLYEEDITNHCFKLNDLQVAVEVVAALIKQVSRVHIIIDGLDECQDRQGFLKSFCPLLKARTYGIVKWFFASRPEYAIRASMREHDVTEIEAPEESLISDIRRYVADEFKDKLDNSCERCIERWTLESSGNFLWITLMLRILEGADLTCEAEIEEELNGFPKGLDRCYMRCLVQLSKRSERQQQLARRTFTMIVGAAQPLHLSELSHALATAGGSTTGYSSARVPKLDLIQDLCSNLVVFDRKVKGSEQDPLLRIAHHSIQEFFLRDPNSLDIPGNLRQYFVSTQAANLELGQSCLTYLSYQRYHQRQEVSTTIETKDHAFLRHAATFWHYYLTKVKPSGELFREVEKFVRSSAFWTCTAVQSLIAPYLFARYSKVTESDYRLIGIGAQEEREEDNAFYGDPLPMWLGEYPPPGGEILQAFHSFVIEWHPVLVSQPSAVDQCAMDHKWESTLPGRNTWLSDRVNFSYLCHDGSWSSNFSIVVMDVKAHSDGIMVTLFDNQLSCDGHHPRWSHVLISSRSGSTILGSQVVSTGHSVEFSGDSHIFSTTYTWDNSFSLIDPSCLRVQRYDTKNEISRDVATKVLDIRPPEAGAGTWRVRSKATQNHQRAITFHCSESQGLTSPRDRTDSGVLVTDETGIPCDNDLDTPNNPTCTSKAISAIDNCMLIVQDSRPPIWHFWKSIDIQVEARCTFHPTEQLAVWSPSPHELCVKCLVTGKAQSMTLPEPVNVPFSGVTAVYKEFQFSESGEFLYYLVCTTTKKKTGIQQNVSLLSFHFPFGDGEDCFLRRMHPAHTISYECAGSVQNPLILTSWTAEYLYIALPPLFCGAKILRLQLPYGEYFGKSAAQGFETLRDPIYFPHTTPYRNPEIKVLYREREKETLILILHADTPHDHSGSDMRRQPGVMTWCLDRGGDWRDFSGIDEQSEELRTNSCRYERLRGTFVDAERRFNVPVRSGLDWTKEAFLSCC